MFLCKNNSHFEHTSTDLRVISVTYVATLVFLYGFGLFWHFVSHLSNVAYSMSFLVWSRGLLLWCTPGAPAMYHIHRRGLASGEVSFGSFSYVYLASLHQYIQERHTNVQKNGDFCHFSTCNLCENVQNVWFRMSVCMLVSVPISNQLFFNISVLLGPPVGRAKLG